VTLPSGPGRVAARGYHCPFGIQENGNIRDPVYGDVVDEHGGAAGVPETEAAPPGKHAARTAWDNPQTPWSGRPRRADILCWAGIVLSGVYYYALLPFRAELLGTHPVVSEVLNGSTEAIIAAAAFARVGHGSLIVALFAAIPGLMDFDALYWWAGRLWGERFINMLGGKRKRGTKYMGRVQRWGRKFTWPAVVIAPFLPIPSAIIFVVVGWAGMRLITFLILDLIGSLLWAGLLVGLGYELGHRAVVVAQAISHYGLWFSLALVALVVFFQVRAQREMMRAARQADAARQSGSAGEGGSALDDA
jgi:membrane-associated protein